MPPPSDAIAWYDANAASAAARFEAHDAAALNSWLLDLLPKPPAVIMDVGAGSGRDAAWLASLDYEVLALEPSATMRAEAQRLHPGDRLRWFSDRLPDIRFSSRLSRYRLRLYLPLDRADLPQSPANTQGAARLGFAKAGFQTLLGGLLSPLDLRVGAVFSGAAAAALQAALQDACDTITRMPATFMTYPGSRRPILPTTRMRSSAPSGGLTIDAARLWSYGEMRVPGELWRALQRYAVWVEPSLIAEWIRLMRAYATRQGRRLDEGSIAAATTWADPARDVSAARAISLEMLHAGRSVCCVWSHVALSPDNLDIDHAFPWTAWPCGDLWNLMPAHPRVNRHDKRDRLPSETVLRQARATILHWWEGAYLDRSDAVPLRFVEEARASLPGLHGPEQDASPDDVFTAMGLQRLRLRFDQGVPEWAG